MPTLYPVIDSYIDSANPTVNYGTNQYVIVGQNGASVNRGLIKFDLSGIAPGASINSAGLEIYLEFLNQAGVIKVYRTRRAWVETQATWNVYSTGNNWQTPGGFGALDCEFTEIGSLNVLATDSYSRKTIPLSTAAIMEIANGTWTNNGFFIKTLPESSTNGYYAFDSISLPVDKASLVITYAGTNFQAVIIS